MNLKLEDIYVHMHYRLCVNICLHIMCMHSSWKLREFFCVCAHLQLGIMARNVRCLCSVVLGGFYQSFFPAIRF